MFIAHFGAGLAAKTLAPRTPLGTLFLAAQFEDLLWPTLLLLGVERVRIDPSATPVVPLDFEYYPISHSLLAAVGWALLVAGLYALLRRDRRGAWVLGALVVSHWLLDAVAHRPDLPWYPGSAHYAGLGLWASPSATLLAESGIFLSGLLLYGRATHSKDAVGRWSLAAMATFLGVIYAANLLGPPPPDAAAVAWVGQAQWLLVAWGYWIDRHRSCA